MVEVSCYGYFICLFMPCTAETLFTFMLLLDYSSLKVPSLKYLQPVKRNREDMWTESVILIFPDLRKGQ